MPTKRTRVARPSHDFMTETHWVWLRDETYDNARHDWFVYHHLDIDHPQHPEPDPPRPTPYLESSISGRALWAIYGPEILPDHIAEWPGTRPRRWWQFSAPENRRRLGGIGTPKHERLADIERYILGVPAGWIRDCDIEIYEFIKTPLDVPALDFADPPMYESEAAYLKRLNLFLPGERRRLRDVDYEPVSVTDIFDFSTEDED